MSRKVKKSPASYGLPECDKYQTSFAHPETISHLVVHPDTGSLITASIDGFVHFSRFNEDLRCESVKIFKAHCAPLTDLSIGSRHVASASIDKTIKVFDILSLEIVKILRLDFIPECVCLIEDAFVCSEPVIMIAQRDINDLYICKLSEDAFSILEYSDIVFHIAYNVKHQNILVSCETGKLAYLSVKHILETDKVKEVRASKLDTKTCKLAFSRNFELLAFLSHDGIARILDSDSLRVLRKFDESTRFYKSAFETGKLKLTEDKLQKLVGAEQLLSNSPYWNIQTMFFDPDCRIAFIPSAIGIKAIDIEENRVVEVYGREDGIRPIAVSLVANRNKLWSVEMAASDNPKAQLESKSVLVTTSFRQPRFYLYTNEPGGCDRDFDASLFPSISSVQDTGGTKEKSPIYQPGHKAVVRTTFGDITIELYPTLTPRAVENFCTLARTGYYDNLLFHRVIRGFMIQTGCPKGDGTGGESIFGGPFANELRPELKHDRPFVVSMANSGNSRSNRSQFFITTIRAPWLDRKHTVFGKVSNGEDVVKTIESVETDRLDRPKQDVRMLAVEILE